MEKFITLNHLKKAVDALLLKINNEKQYYVEKTSVEAASSEGYLIGSVGGIDLYAPSNLLTQNDLNDIYNYINDELGNITNFSIEVVTELPTTGENGVFYFISNSGNGNNIYDEYIYVNNNWEKIGTTEVDLSNYLQKTDIAAWAKAATKPTYTASEVGALPDTTIIPTVPTNVSAFTNDAGYLTSYTETDPTVPDWAKQSTKPTYTANEVGAVPFNNANKTATLNGDSSTLRFQSSNVINQYVQMYVTPNNSSISFQSQQGSAYPIVANVKLKGIASPEDSKDAANKKYVDDAIAGITHPTNVSAFNNDAGYLTSFTETDPTVPAWAKEENKPTYTALEVGAIADTAPAAAITQANINSWNSKLDSFTETDPTVPAWAKQSTKPTYTASEVGALPDTTVIPTKISDLTNFNNFGIGYIDCKNTSRFIFVSNVTFKTTGASDYSSYFLLMFINDTTSSATSVTIAGTGSFYFYDINSNRQNNYVAQISSATIATLKYGTLYIARLNDGNLQLYPLTTSQDINTKISQINTLITTAGINDTEYNLIGTETSNNNTSAVNLYNPSLISFAKSTNFARLTLGDSSIPGVARIYSTSGGFTDIKSGASSTTERTITFPDASGTVALTSNIPNVPSWALATNKPTYTASEVGAVTSSEVSSMIGTAVGNITSFSTEIVQTLPSTGVAGRIYFKLGNDHTNDIYEEYIYVNNAWEKLGNFDASQIDLTDYLKKTDLAAWAKASTKPSYTASEVGALSTSTKYVSTFNGQSGAITYVAPVTSVNGQTGAVSLDIPDADDHKWNDVELIKGASYSNNGDIYIPYLDNYNRTIAYTGKATSTPAQGSIAKYDISAYLHSTTPSANDNSNKVATTAYVDSAIPDITGKVDKAGDTMTGSLALDQTVLTFTTAENTILNIPQRNIEFGPTGIDGSGSTAYTRFAFANRTDGQQTLIHLKGIHTPSGGSTYNNYAASKEYVDNAVAAITDTNTTYSLSISGTRITLTPSSGSATYVDLPVYDGGII